MPPPMPPIFPMPPPPPIDPPPPPPPRGSNQVCPDQPIPTPRPKQAMTTMEKSGDTFGPDFKRLDMLCCLLGVFVVLVGKIAQYLLGVPAVFDRQIRHHATVAEAYDALGM